MMMMCLPLRRGVGFHIGDGDPRMAATPFRPVWKDDGVVAEFGWVLVGPWVVDADLDILDGKLDCHIVYIRAKHRDAYVCSDF